MYSVILSHANSNKASFARLEDIAVFQLRFGLRLLAIDAYAALVDQAPRVAPALGQSRLDDGRNEVFRVLGDQLVDLVWNLTLAKPGVEVRFCSLSRVITVKALDQLFGQRSFRITRLE